jgi:antitoxin component YwqK of YwqJK toxin-antitoxin module
MTKIITITFITLFSIASYGQERKWDSETNEVSYDITYEVAKKSFIIKKISDSTYTVRVNKLFYSETYPYSQEFLYDSIGKPNGKLIVTEKKGKRYAIYNYYNGKQIGTKTAYWKKNRKFFTSIYDSKNSLIADSLWNEKGILQSAFNKQNGSYKSFYDDGKTFIDVSINYTSGTAISKTYSEKGVLLKEELISDIKQYWP